MSMLSRGLQKGFGTLSKGLYRKYETELKEEEAEAQHLREMNMALYKDSLVTTRSMALKEKDAEIARGQAGSGFVMGDKPLSQYEYDNLPEDQKGQAVSTSERTSMLGEEQAEDKWALGRKLDNMTIEADAGEFYELAVERDPTLSEFLTKEQMIADMKFISKGTKGATPLSNAEKIDLIKDANATWVEMAAVGDEEYTEMVAKFGEGARQKFINKTLSSPAFGGSSQADKAGRSISEGKKDKFLDQLNTLPYDQAVQLIIEKDPSITTVKAAKKALKEETDRDAPEDTGTPDAGEPQSTDGLDKRGMNKKGFMSNFFNTVEGITGEEVTVGKGLKAFKQ